MSGIAKHFGATKALKGVSLSVDPGQVLGLIGENGAGKSTLMKVLSGAHKPNGGQMTLEDRPYAPKNPLDARAQGVAMIYQELSLAPQLSITENILLGIEPTAGPIMKWGMAHAKAKEALTQVGLGHLNPKTEVRKLSIAQQQLVEIARAVALDSQVLVLDEPTSSLTQKDIQKLFELIAKLRAKGMSIIYISHFLEEVRTACDRFTVLRDGESVGDGDVASVSDEQIIALMVGREVEDLYPRSDHHPEPEPVLTVNDVAGRDKPTSVSLKLCRGEVVGIAGLVGAGRTEFFRTLFGLDPIVSGEVTLASSGASPALAANSKRPTPRSRWKQKIGMLSEDRKTEGLAVGLSIADNITLPKLEGLGPSVGPWRFVRPSKQAEACAPWIDKIPIKCSSANAPVSSLSGGNQQKVAIARLLHADVDILLLDEPTRGIDVGSKAQVYQLIDQLAKGDPAQGIEPKAVLMISSYLPELMGTCDRIAVMCKGVLTPAKPTAEWDEHALITAATGNE